MKIGLISSINMDGNIDFNIGQIKKYLKEAKENRIDILCFGESFVQGFEGLTWNYEKDKYIASKLNSKEVNLLRENASKFGVALSVGFIENSNDCLYSSNIVISKSGEIIDIYKRVSKGWKEPIASKEYMEGVGFHTFKLMDKTFSTAICGDLWDDRLLELMESIDRDIVLWPLYVDYSIEYWEKKALSEYTDRVKNIKCPVCMINSYVDGENRAKGGCYVFYDNKVVLSLPMGNTGMLIYNF